MSDLVIVALIVLFGNILVAATTYVTQRRAQPAQTVTAQADLITAEAAREVARAEAAKIAAESTVINTNALADMLAQLTAHGLTIFSLQTHGNEQDGKIIALEGLTEKQRLTIERVEVENNALRAEALEGHKREAILMELTVKQKALIDGLPPRVDLLEAALLKLGVVLPPDAEVDAARAAIERGGNPATTPAASDKALHAGDTVTLEAPPDTPSP